MPKKAEPKAKKKLVKGSVGSRKNGGFTPKGPIGEDGLSPKGYVLVAKQQEKDNFPALLLDMMGLISSACRKANIDRSTYYAWREADPKFAADCDAVPELIGDKIESEGFKKIAKGDGEMIRFFLRTKYKSRGFITTTEHTGANGGAISFSNKDEDLKRLSRLNKEQLKNWIELKTILDEPLVTTG